MLLKGDGNCIMKSIVFVGFITHNHPSYPATASPADVCFSSAQESNLAVCGLVFQLPSFIASLAASMHCGTMWWWGQMRVSWQQPLTEGEGWMVHHEPWSVSLELYFQGSMPLCFHALSRVTGLVSPRAVVIIIVTKGEVWCNNSNLSWGFGLLYTGIFTSLVNHGLKAVCNCWLVRLFFKILSGSQLIPW